MTTSYTAALHQIIYYDPQTWGKDNSLFMLRVNSVEIAGLMKDIGTGRPFEVWLTQLSITMWLTLCNYREVILAKLQKHRFELFRLTFDGSITTTSLNGVRPEQDVNQRTYKMPATLAMCRDFHWSVSFLPTSRDGETYGIMTFEN